MINTIRHKRAARTRENRGRARGKLAIVAQNYKAAKLDFIAERISKETMRKAHVLAVREVQAIRGQWLTRQREIDQLWKSAIARRITMENFVDADEQEVDDVYARKSAALAKEYGEMKAYFMGIPIIENLTRKHTFTTSKDGAGNWSFTFNKELRS